ncbi:unnamed protein product [Brugia pahangi]|uniref:Uncharacterized protein n=1 Tax=Brugia pahangi TaxID=6280 RepID=A0A0N4TD70_BRUPA|nr:unnamed protein product [Brugia pahangi]
MLSATVPSMDISITSISSFGSSSILDCWLLQLFCFD